MNTTGIMTTMAEDGKVVIPADYLKLLGINVGDELVMFVEEDEIRVIPRQIALKRAQQLVKSYAGNHRLSNELIEQRRKEAENE
jgi:bifunctional DNA-binding transcriptional regulator/antitoxin component of YhaV-PrlF toxin-antitoxin module